MDNYGVITVSKPCTSAIVLNKDSSGRITVSFHYDPQLVEKAKIASLLKSTPMSAQRVLGRIISPLDNLDLKEDEEM